MNRIIQHAGKDYLVQVDDEDWDVIFKSWWISEKVKGKGYISVRRKLRKTEIIEGRPTSAKLHNEVWEKHFGPIPEGHEVDHIDYDTCNNRKENLRLLTKKENNERARKKKSEKGELYGESVA